MFSAFFGVFVVFCGLGYFASCGLGWYLVLVAYWCFPGCVGVSFVGVCRCGFGFRLRMSSLNFG